MKKAWETELAEFLDDLLAVQDQLLEILSKKREMLKASDTEGLEALVPQEEKLVASLQEAVLRRERLLAEAKQEGLPADSIQTLAGSLAKEPRQSVSERVRLARSRARLLEHHSLTNWVVIQRSLIHLSQVLEIIATGGRLQPTYGKGEPVNTSGALVDRAA